MARFSLSTTGLLIAMTFVTNAHGAAPLQNAQAAHDWKRLTLDWGYELSYRRQDFVVALYEHDRRSDRQSSVFVYLRRPTVAQGLYINSTYSVKTWFGLGLDLMIQEDFPAPKSLWEKRLETLEFRIGKGQGLTLGAFAEFRPGQHSFTPRRGWFIRAGLRMGVAHYPVHHNPNVESNWADDTRVGAIAHLWGSGGYRVHLAAAVSMHLSADVGLGFAPYLGLRLGGGFR